MAVERDNTTDSAGGGDTQSQSPENKESGVEVSGGGGGSELAELRRRWELASVLNFLTVFEPIIGGDLTLSAEEIEAGLISPTSSSLAHLHITLLKGIPPVSKVLDGSDAWVTVLCKKLTPWWPWVAEGEIPIVAAKGAEIDEYKGLEPIKRLLILKALCEVRIVQDDASSFIAGALKQGTNVSSFRNKKIAGDGNGTSFWYEGNKIIGYRLYKGVVTFDDNKTSKAKNRLNPPSLEWETLATNLEEFRKVVDEFSSSKVVAEAVVCRTIQTETIPILEKIQRKKELAIKKKEKEEMILKHRNGSFGVRPTRMCRSHKPVNYTYDDYDQAMNEAIMRLTKTTKPKEKNDESEDDKIEAKTSVEANGDTTEKTMNSDDTMDVYIIGETSSDDEDYTYSGNGDVEGNDFSDSGNSKLDSKSKQTGRVVALRHFGDRWSKKLAGGPDQAFAEIKKLGTKKRMRQRPILNSTLGCVVVPDSEDDN